MATDIADETDTPRRRRVIHSAFRRFASGVGPTPDEILFVLHRMTLDGETEPICTLRYDSPEELRAMARPFLDLADEMEASRSAPGK